MREWVLSLSDCTRKYEILEDFSFYFNTFMYVFIDYGTTYPHPSLGGALILLLDIPCV